MFIKKYKCQKCGFRFAKQMFVRFTKTIIPECPACGSSEAIEVKVEKKEKK